MAFKITAIQATQLSTVLTAVLSLNRGQQAGLTFDQLFYLSMLLKRLR